MFPVTTRKSCPSFRSSCAVRTCKLCEHATITSWRCIQVDNFIDGNGRCWPLLAAAAHDANTYIEVLQWTRGNSISLCKSHFQHVFQRLNSNHSPEDHPMSTSTASFLLKGARIKDQRCSELQRAQLWNGAGTWPPRLGTDRSMH